jgi:hypothetical protein
MFMKISRNRIHKETQVEPLETKWKFYERSHIRLMMIIEERNHSSFKHIVIERIQH